jgi:hypothetical protein
MKTSQKRVPNQYTEFLKRAKDKNVNSPSFFLPHPVNFQAIVLGVKGKSCSTDRNPITVKSVECFIESG